MPTLPIFVLNSLAVGAITVLPDFDPRQPAAIDPAAVMARIEAEKVTTTSGSPAFYAALCHWCALHGRRLRVRALFTGGAPVPPALARLLVDTVIGTPHVVYGSTEAEPVSGIDARAMLAAMSRDARGLPPDGVCVGAPVPEVGVKLIEARDDAVSLDARGWAALEVAPGAVGEIVVCGDHVLTSYLDDPQADRLTKIRDGDRVWHRTGDGGRFDSDGRLWLMGRVRWRIRREGKIWWSLPAEVRALMVQNVRHAAFFGMPDPRLGERAVLVVETLGDQLLDAERDRLERALAPMPVDEILAMPRIPRDPRHESKTDLEALKQWLERRPSVVVM
jgi:acyl-CoA synthetase (AMP-forming)/AMP-acid ligase II